MDQSVDGRLEFGPGLTLVDPSGATIEVVLPGDWPVRRVGSSSRDGSPTATGDGVTP